MATLENVERLRERANVTYEEAKQALDACGDDLLDAMIYLEKTGKAGTPSGGGSYTSDSRARRQEGEHAARDKQPAHGETFSQVLARFLRFCGRIINKGNRNMFDVWRYGELIFSVPVTVLVLLLIISFWIVLPLAVVGLFFGYRYRFSGHDLDNTAVNKAMDSAADAAENFREEMRRSEDGENNK